MLEAVLGRHDLVVGSTVLVELERVLIKKMEVPAQRARETVTFLVNQAEVVQPIRPAAWPLRDPDDRWVVAAALNGNVDMLVSGDGDILDDPQTELDTVAPAKFLDLLRGGQA